MIMEENPKNRFKNMSKITSAGCFTTEETWRAQDAKLISLIRNTVKKQNTPSVCLVKKNENSLFLWLAL